MGDEVGEEVGVWVKKSNPLVTYAPSVGTSVKYASSLLKPRSPLKEPASVASMLLPPSPLDSPDEPLPSPSVISVEDSDPAADPVSDSDEASEYVEYPDPDMEPSKSVDVGGAVPFWEAPKSVDDSDPDIDPDPPLPVVADSDPDAVSESSWELVPLSTLDGDGVTPWVSVSEPEPES